MKKILTLVLLAVACNVFAQSSAPVTAPKNASKSLTSLYPDVREVQWTKTDKGFYEAKFHEFMKWRWIMLDENGKIISSLVEVEKKDFPQSANEELDRYFNDRKIMSYYKHTNKDGVVRYQVDTELGDHISGIIFDDNGNAIGKSSRLKGEEPLTME